MKSSPSAWQLARAIALVALAAATAACGSGLSASEWLWCKQNLPAVDAAAGGLGIAKVQTTFQEPSWLSDYQSGLLNKSNALISANPAFTASCDAAATKAGVGDSRLSWCTSDGLDKVWDSSIALGQMVDQQAETFAYKALPLGKRLDNGDFIRSCTAAYAARTE